MVIKLRKSFLNLLKAAVFIVVIYALYYRVSKINFIEAFLEVNLNYLFLIPAIFLMPVNWFLELLKWKYIAKPVVKVSNIILFKSLLSGVSTGMLTPNRIGNSIGRMVFFRPKHRAILTLGTLYANFAQFLSSILPGIVVFIVIGNEALPNYFSIFQNSFSTIFLFLILLTLFILYFSLTRYSFYKVGKINRRRNLFTLFQHHYKQISLRLFLYSQLRFFVFCIQFFLLLLAFGALPSLSILYDVILIYFLTTLTPSLILGKLFIRENFALLLLLPIINNELIILLASFSIWFINLAIPSLFGLVYLLKVNYDRE